MASVIASNDNIFGRRVNPHQPFMTTMYGQTENADPKELTMPNGDVLEAGTDLGESAGLTGFEVDVMATINDDSSKMHVYWRARFVYEYGGIVLASITKDRVSETTLDDEASWDIDFDVDAGPPSRIRIRVTGSASNSLNWRATLRATCLPSAEPPA